MTEGRDWPTTAERHVCSEGCQWTIHRCENGLKECELESDGRVDRWRGGSGPGDLAGEVRPCLFERLMSGKVRAFLPWWGFSRDSLAMAMAKAVANVSGAGSETWLCAVRT